MSEPNQNDLKLSHTVFIHLLDEAFGSLLIALDECLVMQNEDERFQNLAMQLEGITDQLSAIIDETIDKIPGTLSREEAEERANEFLEQIALMAGMPKEAFIPEPGQLH